MAKKQETKKEKVTVETATTVEQPKVVVKEKPLSIPKKDTWEIKNRIYYLNRQRKPLSYSIKSSGIYYFDKEKGYERELKHTENQRTPFVDEMDIFMWKKRKRFYKNYYLYITQIEVNYFMNIKLKK